MRRRDHALECACRDCAALVTELVSTLTAESDIALRTERAVLQASLRYVLARGRVALRDAAWRASRDYGVAEFAVLTQLQKTLGQGTRRGKPRRQEAA